MLSKCLLAVCVVLLGVGCGDSSDSPEREVSTSSRPGASSGHSNSAGGAQVGINPIGSGAVPPGGGGSYDVSGAGGSTSTDPGSGGTGLGVSPGGSSSGAPSQPGCVGTQMQPGPYELPPEAVIDPSTPVGQFLGYSPTKPTLTWSSAVYPQRTGNYWVYVPPGYAGVDQLPLIVLLEGSKFGNPGGNVRVTVVMDNLIHRGEFPNALVVLVNPSDSIDEYIADDDRQASFLLEELLPLIGQQFAITSDPARRAIGGFGRGAVAALNVAWRHPDSFKYVIMTNGDFIPPTRDWAAMVASSPRVDLAHLTLLSGPNDGNRQSAADRFAGNTAVADALAGAGYASLWLIGDGLHEPHHFGSAFPDILRCFGW